MTLTSTDMQKYFGLMSLGVLQVLFGKFNAKRPLHPNWWRAAAMVVFLELLPTTSLELEWSLVWLYLFHQGSSPPDAQIVLTASSRKSPGHPTRLPFKDYGGHSALRNLRCEFFCSLGQICDLPQFCLSALQPPDSHLFWLQTEGRKALYWQVCPFPNQI